MIVRSKSQFHHPHGIPRITPKERSRDRITPKASAALLPDGVPVIPPLMASSGLLLRSLLLRSSAVDTLRKVCSIQKPFLTTQFDNLTRIPATVLMQNHRLTLMHQGRKEMWVSMARFPRIKTCCNKHAHYFARYKHSCSTWLCLRNSLRCGAYGVFAMATYDIFTKHAQ